MVQVDRGQSPLQHRFGIRIRRDANSGAAVWPVQSYRGPHFKGPALGLVLCSKRFHFALDSTDYVANLAVGGFLMPLPPPSTGTFPGSHCLPHSRERPKPACSTGSLESTKAAPDPFGALTAHQPYSATRSECAANPAALQQHTGAYWLQYPPSLY